MPRALLDSAGTPWESALSSGLAVAVLVDGVDGLALEDVALAEEAVADEIAGLASEGRVAVAYGTPRADAASVAFDVHRMPLEGLAGWLQAVEEGVPVVLAGDPDALPGPAPGAVLRDLVATGLTPVLDARSPESGARADVLAGLRRGELVTTDPTDHEVVVIGCADDATVVHRGEQVVSVSLPRAFELSPEQIVVLSPLQRGTAGVAALSTAIADVETLTVHDAATTGRRWPAVVLCLPGEAAGVLSRALLVSAFAMAERQVSVITAAGSALDVAVTTVPQRPVRRTRLASLLRDASL